MNYALLGRSLKHSHSKTIHESLSSEPYELFELEPKLLSFFLKKREFLGVNVTIPYKEHVMEMIDVLDAKAKRIGSVNTILHRNGKLYGYNTDYDGFVYLLKKYQVEVQDRKVAILGTGGTSKTVSTVMYDFGAREVLLVSRTPDERSIAYEEALLHQDIDIIVNTTPAGMYPEIDAEPLDVSWLPHCTTVIDVIYNPLRTKLLQRAAHFNKQAIGGLEMLVAQAVYASELFHEKTYDEGVIEREYQKIRRELVNLVLIGMPGSGKTSIASDLSIRINKKFVDCDHNLEEQHRQQIKKIFSIHGEPYFRQLERQMVQSVAMQNNQVIATGGGVVMDPANMFYLMANGMIVYVDRPTDVLEISDERPLSATRLQNEYLFRSRFPLYSKYSDIRIENNHDLDEIVRRIQAYYEENTSH